jgi:glycosyltransferase involved in cell wall biosynthesis
MGAHISVAIVHDWLTMKGGAERVLAEILALYPKADLYTIVDFLPEGEREFLNGHPVRTSFIQGLPFARKRYRLYLPLMPLAVEQFDLSAYDLVISSSYAVAKGVMTGPDQVHVSYVHSPMRYAWDLSHQYLSVSNLTGGLGGLAARWMLHRMRLWDTRTANGVDRFVANSQFIARRIRKIYGRAAAVIYPPVDVQRFEVGREKEDFYLTVSRLVPYKRVDLIVEAFARSPKRRLVVIGDGPERRRIEALATPNIEMAGRQDDTVVADYMRRARAFVFAAEEDFGITPVEAQACGTPVILYGKGGGLETVRGIERDAPTGVFFPRQTVESLLDAVQTFEAISGRITPAACRTSAEHFAPERFREAFSGTVDRALARLRQQQSLGVTVGARPIEQPKTATPSGSA